MFLLDSYDIQSGTHDPYEDCVSVMRLYKRIRAQKHPEEEDHGTSTPSNRIVGVPDCWRSKELDNLTPDQLYAMSRSDYKCWCLDLRPKLPTWIISSLNLSPASYHSAYFFRNYGNGLLKYFAVIFSVNIFLTHSVILGTRKLLKKKRYDAFVNI